MAHLLPVQIKLPPKAGRVEHFVKNLQILTNDPVIVDTVRGYQNPFYFASKAIKTTKFVSVHQRTTKLTQRGPISQFFVSCKKKGRRNSAVVSLQDLNRNIMYQHFKMEGLFLLKEMLLPGDTIRKIDLKDAYFAIPCQ